MVRVSCKNLESRNNKNVSQVSCMNLLLILHFFIGYLLLFGEDNITINSLKKIASLPNVPFKNMPRLRFGQVIEWLFIV